MNEQKLILMVGAPLSGKSTWSKKYALEHNIPRISSDELRSKFGWGEGDQTVSKQAFDEAKNQAKTLLISGQSVIIDATNMYKKARKSFLDLALFNPRIKKVAIVFEVDKSILLQRNVKRAAAGGLHVPEHVIDKMLANYQVPDKTEFDEIVFIK